MNSRIHWFLLVLGILISGGDCAAWIPDAQLVRQSRSLEISVLNQTAHVRLHSEWYNPTKETKIVRSWFPLAAGATDIHVFANAEGVDLVEFKEQSRLDALADAAEKEKDVRFFRLGEDPWTRVFRTADLYIEPEKALDLVWDFSVSVEKQGDFEGFEIFLNDGVEDEIFQEEFSLVTLDPMRHFWSPFLAEATGERSEFGIIALQQRSFFTALENFRVMWSTKEDPKAQFYMEGYTYMGHFRSLPPAKDFPKVTIAIDGSGSMSDVWLHVQELLRFLLEHQEGRLFRVVLAHSDTVEWIVGEEGVFVENTSEVRQKILETVAWKSPVGTGNITSILPQIGQPKTDHLLMVFSDEEEIIPLSDSAPVAVLQFFPLEEESSWRQFAMATRGVVQRAFRSIMGTYEAEELLRSVESIREPLFASDVIPREGEVEILPERLVSQFSTISPVFVGRVPSGVLSNKEYSWFEWLPRQWATMNIVEKLEAGERNNVFSQASMDAILAVSRTFGVSTDLFSSETTRQQLEKNLVNTRDIWRIVEYLWKSNSLSPMQNIHLMEAIPLWYESDNIWRSFDFYDRVTPERWVKIAPFSAAQRQLFVLFPEVFSEPFGVGDHVEFCTLFRCFSVVPGGREHSLPSDRAFVRDFDPQHWAIPFVVDLVKKDILKPALNGKLHLDRAISRGDFVYMFLQDLYGEGLQEMNVEPQFTDLLPEEESFHAVQFLAIQGIIGGYTDGTFRPKQDLTRAEAIKILLATEGITPKKINPETVPLFSDTTGWERAWVEEAAQRGIVQGYPDGTFHPHTPLSRAAAAKLIVESRK